MIVIEKCITLVVIGEAKMMGIFCSSNRMRDAYRRRPHDFRRKILKRVATNRQELLTEEYRYLTMIPEEHLGKKFYNLTKHHNGHWSTTDARKDVCKLITKQTIGKRKGIPLTEKHKDVIRQATLKRDPSTFKGRTYTDAQRKAVGDVHRGKILSEETKQKLREARSKQIFSKEAIEKRSTKIRGSKLSEQARQNISNGIKRWHENRRSVA